MSLVVRAEFSPLAWEWEQETGCLQDRHLSGTLLQIIFPSTCQPASCKMGVMMMIMVINCTLGVIIAQGPSLGLLVVFLVYEVITPTFRGKKHPKSLHRQIEPELLLAAVGWQLELDFSEK